MKGIAIAMETIVYIILAVLVLAVLLYFLTSQAAPVQNRAEQLQKAARYCSLYVQVDSTCTKTATVTGIGQDAGKPVTKSDLIDVCNRLGTLDCGVLGDAQRCIQRCCATCPARP